LLCKTGRGDGYRLKANKIPKGLTRWKELESLKQESDEKQSNLDEKNDREQDLVKQNQKLISERDSIQDGIRENETKIGC